MDQKDTETTYQKFVEVIHDCIEKYVHLTHNNREKPKLPTHIRLLLNKKKQLYKLSKQNPDLKRTYKQLEKQYKKAVREHYRDIELKVIKSNSKKNLYGYMKKKLQNSSVLPPLINNNGQLVINPVDKANLLNKHFSDIFLAPDHNPKIDLPVLASQVPIMPEISITVDKVVNAILKLKNSVSVTPDNIPPYFLRQTVYSLAGPLTQIYKKSISEGKAPLMWKKATVRAIFKKGQKNNFRNFRPISITSPGCISLERIIHNDIAQHLETNKLVSSVQHGFKIKRSTLTQHFYFFDQLTKYKSNKTNCNAIYIDFSKAFDCISHAKLLLVLNHYKINRSTLNWIKDFF